MYVSGTFSFDQVNLSNAAFPTMQPKAAQMASVIAKNVDPRYVSRQVLLGA